MFLGRYGVTGQWQVLVLIKHEMEDLMLTHQHCELAKCVQFSAKVSLGKGNPDFQHYIIQHYIMIGITRIMSFL